MCIDSQCKRTRLFMTTLIMLNRTHETQRILPHNGTHSYACSEVCELRGDYWLGKQVSWKRSAVVSRCCLTNALRISFWRLRKYDTVPVQVYNFCVLKRWRRLLLIFIVCFYTIPRVGWPLTPNSPYWNPSSPLSLLARASSVAPSIGEATMFRNSVSTCHAPGTSYISTFREVDPDAP